MDPEGDPPLPDSIAGRPVVKSLGSVVMSGTLWLVGGRVARIVTTVVTLAILARLISPAEFGVVAAAGLADTFVSAVMSYWLGVALLRPKDLPKASIQSQVWASLLIALALTLVTITAAPWLERALRFPDLGAALIAFTPLYFAHALIAASTAVLQRQFRFKAAALVPGVCRILGYSIPAVVMALMGWGMWAIIWAQLLSLVLTAAILVVMARLPLGWPRRFEFRTLGSDGAGGGLYGVVSSLLVNVDTLAVAATLGPAVTGLYTRAYNISVQAKDPFSSLQLTLRQALAAIQDEPRRAEEALIRTLRLAGLGSFIIAAFAVSTAAPLTGVLLGPRWSAAAPILAVLFLGFPARVALLMLDAASMALGQVWPMVARQFVLLVLLAAGAFAAAGLGAIWVAGAVTAAFWLGLVAGAVMLAVKVRLSAARMLATLSPGLVLGLVLGVVLRAAIWLAPDNAFLETAASAALCGLFCAILGALLPDSWLGGYLGDARRRLLGRLRRAR